MLAWGGGGCWLGGGGGGHQPINNISAALVGCVARRGPTPSHCSVANTATPHKGSGGWGGVTGQNKVFVPKTGFQFRAPSILSPRTTFLMWMGDWVGRLALGPLQAQSWTCSRQRLQPTEGVAIVPPPPKGLPGLPPPPTHRHLKGPGQLHAIHVRRQWQAG